MGSRDGKRRAIVTGAARGIGRAVASRLVAEGVEVLAVDRDGERLKGIDGECCRVRVADLADPEQRQALCEEAEGFDYLVNSAGVMRLKSIFEVTVEDWRWLQTINAESVFFLCQGIGPRLKPGGAIVNLSSSSAKLATTVDVAAYAASKTTILSITRSFAYALADRPVRVNAICPGIVDTEMQDSVLKGLASARRASVEEISRQRNRNVPLGRSASAEECAGLIWFLLSDEAGYMTGQAINFTGGMVNW
jgi:NAD(P)-dependent dehydrogenase (short-subunit alcohol dehydrogenase family)